MSGGPLRAALAGLARGAPARVFVLEGADPPDALDVLRLHDGLRLVDTPRSATVLLVAGRLPEALYDAARRAHDGLAHPRATVWWAREPLVAGPPFPEAALVTSADGGASDEVAALAAILALVQADLVRGARASEPALLPNVDPAPWRGVGPYGQGGSGMTGGVPYGRPLTERAPDRDGLELDQLPVRVGPFFAPFPAGLVLDVKLQGDVVQEVALPGNAFARAGEAGHGPDRHRAPQDRPPLLADVERARARHHLRWLAHALRVHGLAALARRTLALSASLARGLPAGVAGDAVALGRLLERTRALAWATADVGATAPHLVAGRGLGPVARAAGLQEDARLDDPAYRAIGFQPVVAPVGGASRGDARARWRQRLAEAVQSLDLAARAGARRAGDGGAGVEGPRGPQPRDAGAPGPSAVLVALLPDLLRDLEWGDAVTTVVSLDIDVREAAAGATPLAGPPAPRTGGGMGGIGKVGGMGGAAGTGHGGGTHAHGSHAAEAT